MKPRAKVTGVDACFKCGGTGRKVVLQPPGFLVVFASNVECRWCKGTGRRIADGEGKG